MSPSPRLAVVLAVVALGALVLPIGLVVAVFLAALVVAVVDALVARRPPAAERRVATHLARGVPAPLVATVDAGPGTTVRVRQPLPPDVELEPAQSTGARLEARLVARRRGRHGLGPVVVRSTGPLGLARWDHDATAGQDLIVYPDLPAARRLAHAVRTGRFQDPGLRPRGPLGLGTEFEQIRQYSPDDDVRRINWRATERAGTPMANQYREDTERDVLCLVDSGRLMAAPVGDGTRLDVALDATVAVVAVADAVGDRSGALAFDTAIRRRLAPRRHGGEHVARTLYDLEPEPVDSDYERAFRDLGATKRSLVLVFTDLVEESAARPLVGAVPVLARRHAVLVASSTDPDLDHLAAADPPSGRASATDVYAAAVARDLLAARTGVSERLRRAGAVVIEAPAERLGAACVTAYLNLKAQARL